MLKLEFHIFKNITTNVMKKILLIVCLFLLIYACGKDSEATLLLLNSTDKSSNNAETYLLEEFNSAVSASDGESADTSADFHNTNSVVPDGASVNGNKYLALGDSYTIGESVDTAQRWPVQLLDKLSKANSKINDLEIIARTGWTALQLKDATSETIKEPPYGLVSLLIGVNDQFQGQDAESFRPNFISLIDRAIKLSGNKKERVFVLSIPDWGATLFANSFEGNEITKQINRFNTIIKFETEGRNVKFYNITTISRKALNDFSLLSDDNLHPSGKMYAQWVALIEKDILSINFN
jgi:lysophospholipase L1-like esterase|nr:lysophospholipase L1 and related esterases [uncultured bacterium]|tara:strand:+ start:82 stop:966 length:885 start_codon:yes stop_codon:yes gene_type:complete